MQPASTMLSTIYRVSLYALVGLVSWILGQAEEGLVPYLTLGVLVVAYVIVEIGGWFLQPGWVANMLGLLSVFLASQEFIQPGQLPKLLSGAHLLVYATWIVLFHEKTLRNFWWLMALGVLQMAVASVLANESSPSFGGYLILYVCGALWTLCVASLYEAQTWLTQESQLVTNHSTRAQSSTLRLNISVPQRWITPRFVMGVMGLIVSSLALSVLFFLFTPRLWLGQTQVFGRDSTAPLRDMRRSGYVDRVRLGDVGKILESVAPVMEVRCHETPGDQPISVPELAERLGMDEPLFRGQVLIHYDRGEWLPEPRERPVQRGRVMHQRGYRIDITLESPPVDDVLFTFGLPDACRLDQQREAAYLNLSNGVLSRPPHEGADAQVSYTLLVKPIPAELARQRAVVLPSGLEWQAFDYAYLLQNLWMPSNQLERLRKLAQDVISELETRRGRSLSPQEKATALETYLARSGRYEYSLHMTVQDAALDPVEDFLFNRRQGHCEYFASALVLMLRAVGIPARLISGYKGGEYNTLKGCWEVQQRHAHVWVEAWLQDLRQWVVLEPTPADPRRQMIDAVAERLGFWGRMRATTATLWSDYVMNVNLTQQQRRFYEPLLDYVHKGWDLLHTTLSVLATNVGQPGWWRDQLAAGGLKMLMLGLIILIAAVILTAALIWTMSRLRGFRQQHTRATRQIVAFYERFLKLMQCLGCSRQPHQTATEFARECQLGLQALLASAQLESLPATICESYHRVRFGGEHLSSETLEQLNRDLERLETLLPMLIQSQAHGQTHGQSHADIELVMS